VSRQHAKMGLTSLFLFGVFPELSRTFAPCAIRKKRLKRLPKCQTKNLLRLLLSACQCQERDSAWRRDRDGHTWPGTGFGRKWECSPSRPLFLLTYVYLSHAAPASPT